LGFPALLSLKRFSHRIRGIKGLATIPAIAVGAVALAAAILPMKALNADSLEIFNTDGILGNDIGLGALCVEHTVGATEGYDWGIDSPWGLGPPPPYSKWLSLSTRVPEELDGDVRSETSETSFNAELFGVVEGAGTITCPNKLYFEFKDPPDPNRVYLAAIHCDGAYTPNGQPFDTLVNIREVVDSGGFVDLPGIVDLPHREVYGTCDIHCAFKGPGDTDANGVVDGLDLTSVLTAWMTSPGDALWNPEADLDASGVVDGLDLTEVISNWTVSSAPAGGVNVVVSGDAASGASTRGDPGEGGNVSGDSGTGDHGRVPRLRERRRQTTPPPLGHGH